MNKQIEEILEKFPKPINDLYLKLEKIIKESTDQVVTEGLWAKLPTYYVGDKFIRLIPFKNHINIEAKGIANNLSLIENYKITPKLMIQIFLNQEVDSVVLNKIFKDTFYSKEN